VDKREITFENNLVKTIKRTRNTLLLEEIVYSYKEDSSLIKKQTTRYTKNGKIHHRTISYYDDNENVVRVEQKMGERVLSVRTYVYDDTANVVEQSLSADNNKSLEKTLYIYKYY
jgi:hypothetical protein